MTTKDLHRKKNYMKGMYINLLLFIFLISKIVVVNSSEDYYEILGIRKDADNREIRRAFKKLAITLHPDKNQDDPEAHEKFLKINKAYEVLKDEEMRKKYDLYGEEGLDDSHSSRWRGNFHSWKYYSESFGIYDDDLEIITLNKNEFEQSVHNSPDIWFVNFYSPQCSHCHQLAPAWRALARDLEGVIRIGAVNCEEDWVLCRNENIWSYPSLILYPEKIKYQGSRETEHMIEYVLKQLPNKIIKLAASNIETVIKKNTLPWLISFCLEKKACLFSEDLKKFSIMMDGLVNVAEIYCYDQKSLCEKLDMKSGIAFFPGLSSNDYKYQIVSGDDNKDLAHEVLQLLPDPLEISREKYQEILKGLREETESSWLIYFKKENNADDKSISREMKRLTALLPDVKMGQLDCSVNSETCKELYVQKFPTFIVFKIGGSYEIHHGRANSHDIAGFARESLISQVETLGPDVFPTKIIVKNQPWLIDFFAPWCPPCMHLLPEVRKASRIMGHKIRFGTIDCTIHSELCSKYNIRNYPTTILYNDTYPHIYYGNHVHRELIEFIQDILSPPVIDLTPLLFSNLVEKKSTQEIWVIDYFAPWCRPCQQLSIQWRKLAKMMLNDTEVHIASVNCQTYKNLCQSQGVSSYPDIRLYPRGSQGINTVSSYNNWNRDAVSLRAWIYSFLPSSVESVTSEKAFKDILLDRKPWVIDFYAPWCGHCQTFAPEFEVVSKKLSGKVNAGKVNCDALPNVCQEAGVSAYPTVRFYSGSTGGRHQNSFGQEIDSQRSETIIDFISNRIKKIQKDEL
ncbi:dnaJ homolog subfamily C member 10-like [Centruroides vittatus]|uniref:dnaJ homolog subfamily C member 10-like n=1 Tax=Centruroides vittatus TaxID=120091 RepID=UPI003510ADE2